MHRRSFVGALLAAPVALPVAAKAVMEVAPTEHRVVDKFRVNDDGSMTWTVRLDKKGNVVGFTQDPMPVFTISNIDGQSRVTIREDYIEHLDGLAARQNVKLA